MELLKFLAEYKMLFIDNAKYIYNTVTYHEKRIVALVKNGYIKRLKHKYIVLDSKGARYLEDNNICIRLHCRNSHNIDRLSTISDIASFLIKDGFNFVPSWRLKDKNLPTEHSRRYIGRFEHDKQLFLVYTVDENKNTRYIKSIHYDIKKENEIKNAVIFAKDLRTLMFGKTDFFFERTHTLLVPYNEYGKFIFRNNIDIRCKIFYRLKELYNAELTDFEYADVKTEDDKYIKIMLVINFEWMHHVRWQYKENLLHGKELWVFCLEDLEPIMKEFLPECNYKTMNKEKILSLLDR